jgi:hypothetical protein
MRNSKIITIAALFLSISSWAYVPPIINASLINSKGEFEAGITYGSTGAEQYLSYGLADDLFINVNSSFSIDTIYNGSNKRSHYFFEGGFVYSLTASSWVFTMGGNYGYGQFYSRYDQLTPELNWSNDNHFSSDLHKFSIQADIGVKKEFFELAFSHRFAVGYFSLNSDQYRLNNSTISFYEPGVTVKAGPGKIKFFAQGRLSLPLNQTGFDMSYGAISLGFVIHLGYKEPDTGY